MPTEQQEIPGTEAPKIKPIENAAEKYVDIRDTRMEWTKKEVAAKAKLEEVINEHREKLTPDADGVIHYRYGDDMHVIMKPGKTKIKVKHESAAGDDDEED